MRILLWLTIGFTFSCGLFAYFLDASGDIIFLYTSLAVSALFLLGSLKWKKLRIPATVTIGCVAGMCWCMLFQHSYLTPVNTLDQQELSAAITVTDHSYETSYGLGTEGRMDYAGKSYQVRVYLDPMDPLFPGDQFQGRFLLRLTTPDGSRESSYHQGNGTFLLAYQRDDVTVTHPEKLPFWAIPGAIRQKMQAIMDICFTGENAAFAKALLLGDTTGMDYETDTDLKLSGIRHVVAVSGLHVSILFALISTMTFRKRWLKALLGLPALLVFAAIAGFSPSVVRACIMSALMLLASLSDREYDGPTALSFAVLVMLMANPMAITSVSLQLSALSVAGILLFQKGIQNWLLTLLKESRRFGILNRLRHWLASSMAVTLSAMSLTTPLSAYYFGTVSLIGPLTNLLTLWVISFLFYGLMAVCVLYLFWNTGAFLLAKAVTWLIRYVLGLARIFARLSLSAVYTQSIYIVLWLILCYLLLAVFLLQRDKKPGLLLSCAVIGLCLACLASWTEPMLEDTRLTVLDVGQGQAILLHSEGRTYLVDCGGDSESKTADIISGTLLSQGIRRLDGIILTHYDADHSGALDELLTRIPTEVLFVPDTADTFSVPQAEHLVCYVDQDMQLSFGNAQITLYGPIYSGSSNENSLCILFESETCAILITGDRTEFGERMLLRHTQLPDVDVLIAGHHGAKSSTSEALLQAVTPETVVISVGLGNYYGHPHADLLNRLEAFGCTVYRTDLHGTIIIRR